MNWYKAKTIMIIFLMAVNLSLLTYIIYDAHCQRVAGAKVIENVLSILSENNISVDKKVIADAGTKDSIKEAYAYNIISDYDGFAKLIIGNEAQLTDENTYTSPSGNIRFSGDRFYSEPHTNMCTAEFNTGEKNIVSTVKTLLSKLGISANENDISISKDNGLSSVQILKSINKLPVFGPEIKMTLSSTGIASFEGAWYEPETQDNTDINLKSISGCLIDYMNKRTSTEPCTVTKITLGYAVPDSSTYHASLALTPVYAIENNLGETIYIDAGDIT